MSRKAQDKVVAAGHFCFPINWDSKLHAKTLTSFNYYVYLCLPSKHFDHINIRMAQWLTAKVLSFVTGSFEKQPLDKVTARRILICD